MQTQFLVWKWPLGNAFLCFIDAQSFWHVMSETVVLPFLFTLIKKGHLHLFTHEVVFPIGSHWPKFVAHKLWGRDRWWGLEPPQIEHARPRAKYKLELTVGWVCWLWNAGHVFLLIAIHQIQKYLQNVKFVETAQWGLFSPPSEVGQPKLCCVYMLLTAPKHIYMWPASRTWFEVRL